MIRQPTKVDDPAKRMALDCLAAGIQAANPERVIANEVDVNNQKLHISNETDKYDLSQYKNIIVVGGGNAAGLAASALESSLGKYIDHGAVVTDTPATTDTIDILPGDHPVPSERGVESTQTMLDIAREASKDDLIVAVITGGGSALMTAPAEGVSLTALQTLNEELLASGATIGEINTIRKHCSNLKGGRLAKVAAPATIVGLVFSDVIGNRLDVIASGPTTPDDTTFADARSILSQYDVSAPKSISTHLAHGENRTVSETPGSNDPVFDFVINHIIADNHTALRAAAEEACDTGYDPLVLGSRVRGEAREAAKALVGIAEECAANGTPVDPPTLILSGGETTVTVTDDGVGGPNQEFVLSAALELSNPDVTIAAVDTDGIDGNADAAGAVTSQLSKETIRDGKAALANNDAARFFNEQGGAIITGPTGTNVNDLRVFVIAEQ